MGYLLRKNSWSQMGQLLILYGETITVNLQTQEKKKKTGERRRDRTRKKEGKTQTNRWGQNSSVSNMITPLASPSTRLCCNTPTQRRRKSGSRRLNVAVGYEKAVGVAWSERRQQHWQTAQIKALNAVELHRQDQWVCVTQILDSTCAPMCVCVYLLTTAWTAADD